MIKGEMSVVKRNGISYLYQNKKQLKYSPWIGNQLSFLYDLIMRRSVFPKKFEASIEMHMEFLKDILKNVHNKDILELATGSGNVATALPCDNRYTGTDISEGLLKIALRRFVKAGFKNFEFYLCSADALPFQENSYDICICNLSLNFFGDLENVIKDCRRILRNEGYFICSVPVPEKNKKASTIRGKIFSENELKNLFEKNKFAFRSYDFINGALLYFKAVAKE